MSDRERTKITSSEMTDDRRPKTVREKCDEKTINSHKQWPSDLLHGQLAAYTALGVMARAWGKNGLLNQQMRSSSKSRKWPGGLNSICRPRWSVI
jgi:hypothetical protein